MKSEWDMDHREDLTWKLIEGFCWLLTKLVRLSGREFL